MSRQQDPESQFKNATAAAIRAMAEAEDLQVEFGQPDGFHNPEKPLMPQVPEQMPEPSEVDKAFGIVDEEQQDSEKLATTLRDNDVFRGKADRIALWYKYHDYDVPINRPAARQHLQAVESVRTEILGSTDMAGIVSNLRSCARKELREEIQHLTEENSGRKLKPKYSSHSVLAGYLRANLLHDTRLKQLAQSVIHPKLAKVADSKLEQLKLNLADQSQYQATVIELLVDAGLLKQDPTPEEQDEETADEEQEQAGHEGEDEGQEQNQESIDTLEQELENSDELDTEDVSYQMDDTFLPDLEELEDVVDEYPPIDQQQEKSWLEEEIKDSGIDYKVYTTEYDRVATPAELMTPQDNLEALRALLDATSAPYKNIINKLANRLQRIIAAQQLSNWKHDLEEGILNPARLVRIVTDPLQPASFKQEEVNIQRDTVVTILIDSSGSMRGKLIALAATTAEIVAATLERCGVTSEVLGFTTSAWKGGESYRDWVRAGRPTNPGRLNDLLHIVYKDGDTSWQRARLNMGFMLKEGLLKENIDGEALVWAHDRLMRRSEKRKILLVISDGAPVDDSTNSTNRNGLLESHLRLVISTIERSGGCELRAIGIGHDVGRYYQEAVTIHKIDDLTSTVVDQLTELFKPKKSSQH